MNYNWLLGLFFLIFVLSGNLFADEIVTQQQLRDTIERCLMKGDSAKACLYYKQLSAKVDSVAQDNYHKKAESFRDIYQINQLYLENRLQKQKIWQLSILYSGIFILLLVWIIFYLWFIRKRLEHWRLIAQEKTQLAEHSMKSRRQLLWSVSRGMHNLIVEINNKLEELHLGKLGSWEKTQFFEEFKEKTDALHDFHERMSRKESDKE